MYLNKGPRYVLKFSIVDNHPNITEIRHVEKYLVNR